MIWLFTHIQPGKMFSGKNFSFLGLVSGWLTLNDIDNSLHDTRENMTIVRKSKRRLGTLQSSQIHTPFDSVEKENRKKLKGQKPFLGHMQIRLYF